MLFFAIACAQESSRFEASLRLGGWDLRVGAIGGARLPVDIDESPPLLIKDLIWVRPAARGSTANVVDLRAAILVFPPLIGELEDEAA